jgi:hypothetical protein
MHTSISLAKYSSRHWCKPLTQVRCTSRHWTSPLAILEIILWLLKISWIIHHVTKRCVLVCCKNLIFVRKLLSCERGGLYFCFSFAPVNPRALLSSEQGYWLLLILMATVCHVTAHVSRVSNTWSCHCVDKHEHTHPFVFTTDKTGDVRMT